MSEFDVEAFITQLDRMGMKLTALRMADGKFKVYRWRLVGASEHAQQIEDLWNSQGSGRDVVGIMSGVISDKLIIAY